RWRLGVAAGRLRIRGGHRGQRLGIDGRGGRAAWRGGRGGGEVAVVVLGEDDQVIEVDYAVEVEVALGPGHSAGRVVVLGELDQVVEIDSAVVVGIAGEDE